MNDVAARQAVVKAFELTELGGLLIRYVQMFKPAKQALSMTKLAKMLDELVPMVKAGQITRNGTIYSAPQAYWQQGIETMLASRDKLSLPLKSHGYLLEIISSFANKASANAEKQNEQGRKYGEIKVTGNQLHEVMQSVDKRQKPKREAKLNLGDTLKHLTGKAQS